PDSAHDAEFVRALGARLGVPVDAVGLSVAPGRVEAAARAARHAALEAAAERLGAARIALGHTADDQAETLMMRVLEGTGVRGLASIPPVRGRVIRPLIESRHREAVAALTTAGLSWLEDPSNRDPRFFRNRVRHALLPRLADEAGGDLVARLGRLARRARTGVDAAGAHGAGARRVAGDRPGARSRRRSRRRLRGAARRRPCGLRCRRRTPAPARASAAPGRSLPALRRRRSPAQIVSDRREGPALAARSGAARRRPPW